MGALTCQKRMQTHLKPEGFEALPDTLAPKVLHTQWEFMHSRKGNSHIAKCFKILRFLSNFKDAACKILIFAFRNRKVRLVILGNVQKPL